MSTYQRILLPTDFSETSRKALAEAVRVARRHHAQLHVLHVDVLSQQTMAGFDYPPLADYIRSIDQVALDAVGRDFGAGYCDTVPAILRDTSEAAGILRYAADKQIDLVVMGTHGRGALAEALIGSVTQRVVQEAPVPVLVVGPRRLPGAAFGGRPVVLAPVDLTAACAASLAQAGALAAERDAHLVVLHAIDPAGMEISDAHRRDQVEQEARERLERFVLGARLPVEAEVLVGRGYADEVIFDIAAKRTAGLIVIAPSSHGRVERLLLGSVTRRVVRGAPVPVLVHRQPVVRTEARAAA
jgi:nucleotide-binding universal stress UspA family protein